MLLGVGVGVVDLGMGLLLQQAKRHDVRQDDPQQLSHVHEPVPCYAQHHLLHGSVSFFRCLYSAGALALSFIGR